MIDKDTCLACGWHGSVKCIECEGVSIEDEREQLLDLILKHDEVEHELIKYGYITINRPSYMLQFNSDKFLSLARRQAKSIRRKYFSPSKFPHELSFSLGGYTLYAIYDDQELQELLESQPWLDRMMDDKESSDDAEEDEGA